MAKALTEFIGTFFLLFAIGSGRFVDPGWHPLIIGLTLTLMVYLGGSISGAHFNPAVTLGIKSLGKMTSKEVTPYIISQILGGVCGMSLAMFFTMQMGLGNMASMPLDSSKYMVSSFNEIIFTFMLMLVILNVALTERTKNNTFYGFAIGGVVVVGAMIGGKISGGAYNPAVGVAVAARNLISGSTLDFPLLAIHIVCPIVGAMLATQVFKIQEKHAINELQEY